MTRLITFTGTILQVISFSESEDTALVKVTFPSGTTQEWEIDGTLGRVISKIEEVEL